MGLFKEFLNHFPVATIVLKENHQCFYANPQAITLFQHQLINYDFPHLFPDSEMQQLKDFLQDYQQEKTEFHSSQLKQWFLFKKAPFKSEEGESYTILGLADITERKERELYEKPLLRLSQLSSIATLLVNSDLTITYANNFFYKLYQYDQPVIGKKIWEISGEPEPEDFIRNAIRTTSEKGLWRGDDIRKKGDGTDFNASSTMTRVTDQNGIFLCYADISRDNIVRTQREASLKELTVKDPLTGIPNRRSFNQTFEKQWQQAIDQKTSYSLLICDIDYFKRFNDHYGHLAGDECLIQVAQALDKTVRGTDFVARYGGEEFVILLPKSNSRSARKVGEKLRLAVEDLEVEHEQTCVPGGCVTISIGVATIIPTTEDDPQAFLNSSDEALYQAKESGRNRVFLAANIPVKNIKDVKDPEKN